MGQKVNPTGFRLGIIRDWESKWFSKKEYADFLHEDLEIRAFVKKKFVHGGISKVRISRAGEYIKVDIYTARPGVVIGKKGQDIENLKTELQEITDKQIYLNVIEIKNPELDAQLVAQAIAMQLLKKISYRRAMKKVISNSMNAGALGIKICCSGRLGGAEIARSEWLKDGRIPLHTLRADVDYGFTESFTKYGKIGVKVWIFKGEILNIKDKPAAKISEKDDKIVMTKEAPGGTDVTT